MNYIKPDMEILIFEEVDTIRESTSTGNGGAETPTPDIPFVF